MGPLKEAALDFLADMRVDNKNRTSKLQKLLVALMGHVGWTQTLLLSFFTTLLYLILDRLEKEFLFLYSKSI